jgi:HK97 family phage major capsid protein
MSIILRKIGGRLTALFRSKGGLAFAGGRSTSVAGFSLASILTSPLVLTVLVIAFVVAWSFAHPVSVVGVAAAHKLTTFALAGMAAPITELRQKRATLAKKANDELTAVQAKAKAENRVLTAEELQAQDAYDAQIAAVDQEIQLEERKLDRERASGGGRREDPADRRAERESGGRVTQVTHVHNRAEDDRARGFRSHREFLLATMENAGFRNREEIPDERLRPLAVLDATDRQAAGEQAFLLPEAFTPRGLLATVGSDEQGAYSDAYGGFGVPTTRLPGLLSIGFEGDPTAGRTQPVPMATPSIEIPARTDKNHSTSVSGGFTVSRKAETAAAAASRGQMEMVTMKAASLFGLAYATEEILTDSPISFAALIDSGFRDQFPAHLLNEKIRGNGGNEFTGYLNSPAAVTVAAEGGQAADTINSANIINMASRIWGQGAVWIANHDTRPQLAVLSITIGTGGVLLYQPAQTEGFPDMLWGKPVFYTEFASKLGDVGDIALVNFSQYLEGLYQPLQSAESVHVRFVNHERAFKFWLRNAGAPWWRSALTPAKSAQTLSPIVLLAAR